MTSAEQCYHQLEVYTANVCWRGKILVGSQRRISDFMNDLNTSVVTLENATAWSWKPNFKFAKAQEDTITIVKRNIVFVVHDGYSSTSSNQERVQKKSQTIGIHAPPFSMMGSVFFAREAHYTSVMNTTQREFIPMTDTTIWRIDDNTILPVRSGFVAVNRVWIESLFPTQPHTATEPVVAPTNKQSIRVG